MRIGLARAILREPEILVVDRVDEHLERGVETLLDVAERRPAPGQPGGEPVAGGGSRPVSRRDCRSGASETRLRTAAE